MIYCLLLNFIPTYVRLTALLAVIEACVSAGTLSFPGPTTPLGVPCQASDPSCVVGGSPFAIFGIQLTQPSGGNPNWTLTIETNYPNTISGNMIPTVQWGADGQFYSISDVLINWQGVDYGIVLSQHIKAGNPADSYVAGNLYQAPNILFDLIFSGNPNDFGAPGLLPSAPRRDDPIWLAPGGTLRGNGTVTVVAGGNGTPAQYTITDQFSAPAGFLSNGTFQIEGSSWVCFNGVIVGTGSFVGAAVPEPGTLILSAVGLLLLLRFRLVHRTQRQ